MRELASRPVLSVMAALIPLAVAAVAARAAPPPGTNLKSPEHRWWECQVQPSNGRTCCSEADGHVLSDNDWRVSHDHYQVRVDGTWFDVPPDAVITHDARCGPEPVLAHRGAAKVWYAPLTEANGHVKSLTFYCFLPGTMY